MTFGELEEAVQEAKRNGVMPEREIQITSTKGPCGLVGARATRDCGPRSMELLVSWTGIEGCK